MSFSFRPARLVTSILALSLAFAMACDETTDDTDKKGAPHGNEGKAGYAEGCVALRGPTDVTKTEKSEITDYLVNACSIGEYFKSDAFESSPQTIGSSCYCYGRDCSAAGFERPEEALIVGCDNVPEAYKGAIRGCFRSTNAAPAITPVIHFANGQCTLLMSMCTPVDSHICSFATFGDYSKVDEFTTCPGDDVPMDISIEVAVNVGDDPQLAQLDVRMCIQTCTDASDCRQGEFDAAVGAPAQLDCIEIVNKAKPEETAKVCIDQRVLDLDPKVSLVTP